MSEDLSTLTGAQLTDRIVCQPTDVAIQAAKELSGRINRYQNSLTENPTTGNDRLRLLTTLTAPDTVDKLRTWVFHSLNPFIYGLMKSAADTAMPQFVSFVENNTDAFVRGRSWKFIEAGIAEKPDFLNEGLLRLVQNRLGVEDDLNAVTYMLMALQKAIGSKPDMVANSEIPETLYKLEAVYEDSKKNWITLAKIGTTINALPDCEARFLQLLAKAQNSEDEKKRQGAWSDLEMFLRKYYSQGYNQALADAGIKVWIMRHLLLRCVQCLKLQAHLSINKRHLSNTA